MRKQQHRYKAYSARQTVPSTAQIRAEGNNTKCVGNKVGWLKPPPVLNVPVN
jgi:hypothetical protein